MGYLGGMTVEWYEYPFSITIHEEEDILVEFEIIGLKPEQAFKPILEGHTKNNMTGTGVGR